MRICQNLSKNNRHRTHFNSPEGADDAALNHRMLQNRSLAEKYSLEILKQCNHYIAAQIDTANGRNRNHLLLPANDAAAASGGAVALETISTDDAPTAVIEILKQGIMNLALTSAEYCDKFIKMNPPLSSS